MAENQGLTPEEFGTRIKEAVDSLTIAVEQGREAESVFNYLAKHVAAACDVPEEKQNNISMRELAEYVYKANGKEMPADSEQ